jgi:YfiH family protein
MKVTETNLGFLIETEKFTALFGGQKAALGSLKTSFEEFNFIRVKQTHGDKSVLSADPTLDYQVEADAHFTKAPLTALCVSTADCMPILIYDPKMEFIAAIHAGWRGVVNRIVPKTIEHLKTLGCQPENLQILLGPHIQMNSFEVKYPVRDEILSSIHFVADHPESLYHRNISGEKTLVNLNQVMKTQLQETGIQFDHLYNLYIDTFSDLRFHSFRREKEKAGRQLSFICRT